MNPLSRFRAWFLAEPPSAYASCPPATTDSLPQSAAPELAHPLVDGTKSSHQSAVPAAALKKPKIMERLECPRTDTIQELADMIWTSNVIHIRGTPASGKTTLAGFLREHLVQNGETVVYIEMWRAAWTYKENLQTAARERGLNICDDALSDANVIWIIDEGQASYADDTFWTHFVKKQHGRKSGAKLVFFTSYGSPTAGPSDWTVGSPLAYLGPPQRVSITVSWAPGSSNISLFLNRVELSDMVTRLCGDIRLPFKVTPDALQYLWEVTRGHPGAIYSIISVAALIYRRTIKHEDRPITAKDLHFMIHFNAMFYVHLQSYPVWRSFPNQRDGVTQFQNSLSKESSAVLKRVLREDFVVRDLHTPGVEQCYKNGWLHSEMLLDGTVALVYPTPFHAIYAERFLSDTQTPFPLHRFANLQELTAATLRTLNPRLLRQTSHLGIGATYTIPEACFQHAFRAAMHELLGFTVYVSSEWSGSDKGRVDFFIESTGWAIELTRDGDRMKNHLDRFEPNGKYHEWYEDGRIKDWIVLDFRKTATPSYDHVGAGRLWRVVLQYDGQSELPHGATVLDGGGRVVCDRNGADLSFALISS